MIPSKTIKTTKWEPGTYDIDAPEIVPKNRSVDASGVTLVVTDTGYPALLLDTNASISGVTIRLARFHPDYVESKPDLSKFNPV